jgi:hypothetical protein
LLVDIGWFLLLDEVTLATAHRPSDAAAAIERRPRCEMGTDPAELTFGMGEITH